MANGWDSLIGGFAQGFGNAKNAAKERQLNEDYKKVLMEQVKAHGKLQEAQIAKLDMEGGLLKWAMGGAAPGETSQVSQSPMGAMPPVSQVKPSIPDTLAQGQLGGMAKLMAPFAGTVGGGFGDSRGDRQHMGTDYIPAGGAGTPILAPTDMIFQQGGVGGTNLRPNDKWGHWAVPGTPNQIRVAHVGEVPEPGTMVKQGQPIGTVGNAINSPHLHMAVWDNATQQYVDTAGQAGATRGMQLAAGQPLGQPQDQFQPQPIAQGQSQITTPQPASRGGLTREKFLEGYMKKNFGVEPDEIKDVRYGDHTLIIDKKKGTPLFMIAGQGKTEMIDVALPDGSVVKRPTVVPPSPLPGGIPVINLPGGTAGIMAGPGMQVKPKEYTYDETIDPTGKKMKRAVPKAQEGLEYQTGEEGIKQGDVGKTNLILHANEKIREVNNLLFPRDKLDRSLLFKAAAPGGGIGDGATYYSKMYQTVDAALRLETGAQATPGEIDVKMKEFWPSLKDTESAIREKSNDLNKYVNGLLNMHDPTGGIRKMRGTSLQVAPGLQDQKPKTWEELKQSLIGGR